MRNSRSVYVEKRIYDGATSDALAHSLNSRSILSGIQSKLASSEDIIYVIPHIYWRLDGYNC